MGLTWIFQIDLPLNFCLNWQIEDLKYYPPSNTYISKIFRNYYKAKSTKKILFILLWINLIVSKKRQGEDALPNYVELLLEFDEFAGGGGVGGLDAGEVEARRKGAGVDGD